MAKNGVTPAKPAWFEFNRYKTSIRWGVISVGIAIGVAWAIRGIGPATKSNQPFSATNESKTIHLRAVGDIMMSRSVGLSATKRQNWNWPFEGTIPLLPLVDLTIGNLEFPLTDPCQLRDHVMIFCAPSSAVNGLVYGKIDLVSLANNHSYNYGEKGMADTKATLTQAGIKGVVEYQSLIVPMKGIPIGFLALDDSSHSVDMDRIYPLLSDLKANSQAVIVMIHWGNEYQDTPSVRQKTLASALIDHGATIILGTHPHVLQPIESTPTSLIAYSLGNFIFDQMWSEATRKSIILELDLTFVDNILVRISHKSIPITIYDYGQPRINPNVSL